MFNFNPWPPGLPLLNFPPVPRMARPRTNAHSSQSTRTPRSIIPSSILSSNPNPQLTSPLLTRLPLEILHKILLSSPIGRSDKLFVSLSCKLLAKTLAQAKPSSTFSTTHGALMSTSFPKPVSKDSPTATITNRTRFMYNLKKWMKEEDGWYLCGVCLVFKRRSGNRNAKDWMYLRRGWDKNVRKTERGKKGNNNGEAVGEEEGGWGEDSDDDLGKLWVCPKHKIEASRLVQLRDK